MAPSAAFALDWSLQTSQIETIELNIGDRILYQKYTGQEITVDKQEYIVIRFQDVLARLEESAAPAPRARAAARK